MQVTLAKRESDDMTLFRMEVWVESHRIPVLRRYLENHDRMIGSEKATGMFVDTPAGMVVYRKVVVTHPAHLPNFHHLLLHLLREFGGEVPMKEVQKA